jgi:hypothetical protein
MLGSVLYVDATSGGLLIQLLLGGAGGVALIGRLVWYRLTRRRFKAPATDGARPAVSNE